MPPRKDPEVTTITTTKIVTITTTERVTTTIIKTDPDVHPSGRNATLKPKDDAYRQAFEKYGKMRYTSTLLGQYLTPLTPKGR
jgi:hypothetical protein